MLASVGALGAVGTVEVDAAVGRQARDIANILGARAAGGALPSVVVVQTGNNGPVTQGQLDEILTALASVERVVLVNVRVDRPWEGGNNELIAGMQGRFGNVRVVDWYGSTAGHPELFYDDGIHPRPDGAALYASLVSAAINGG